MEESKLPEEFSLIKEYNLHRVRRQQSEYPICWAHALAEMITNSVRIYQIDAIKSMQSSKRRRIDEKTYTNTDLYIYNYVYKIGLIYL